MLDRMVDRTGSAFVAAWDTAAESCLFRIEALILR
jgi:hypothetical protein